MTDEMPQSPLVKKFMDAARTDPDGVEAGLENAMRKIERWMDERLLEGDRRRQLQIRVDRALADARMQLDADDWTKAALADGDDPATSGSAESVTPRPVATTTTRRFRPLPIAAAIVLACIVVAGLGWRMGFLTTAATTQPLFVLDAGTRIVAGKENTIDRIPGEAAFTLFSTAKKPESGGVTGGAYLALGPEIEDIASGRMVRVTIRATPDSDRPSRQFAIAYSTAAVGNSGWRKFRFDSQLQSWSFEYAVPKRQQDPGADIIGIWADTSGGGGGIRIEDILVERIEATN